LLGGEVRPSIRGTISELFLYRFLIFWSRSTYYNLVEAIPVARHGKGSIDNEGGEGNVDKRFFAEEDIGIEQGGNRRSLQPKR